MNNSLLLKLHKDLWKALKPTLNICFSNSINTDLTIDESFIQKNYFERKNLEIDFSQMKHAKEVKSTSFYQGSESFVFGKMHYVFDLRLGFGKQLEMYMKRDPGSIAVRYFYSFGPSLAFKKPIYYEIYDRLNDRVSNEKFNAEFAEETNATLKNRLSRKKSQ